MDLSQKTLGAKIAALRKIRNMTQEQLAAQLGISAPAVSKWETGSSYPDITLLAPLARALGTNLDMIRYFTQLSGGHCQGDTEHPVCRSKPEPYSTGAGRAVPGGRNQSQELLPRCVWRKPLHIFAGGEDAPGRRIAAEQ